jgi:peroxiredoxin
MKLVILIVVSIALTLFAQTKTADDYLKTTLVKVGEKAPDFACRTLSGENFSLSEQKGKVILVTFFATWCPHCQAELPQIDEKIYKVLKDRKDFRLIVIARKQNASEVEKFEIAKKLYLPFALDPKGEIYGKYASKYIPRSFVIGKDGKIKLVSKGSPDGRVEEILQAIKNELIKKN